MWLYVKQNYDIIIVVKKRRFYMIEYKVISANWIEVAEGYGYWSYQFEEVKE